ncbi:MAG: DUF1570 domain-containing protein [Planctomycetota bacterium]
MALRSLPLLLLSSVAIAQAPPGFKTYENKLAPLTFYYSTSYKEVPLPPTEQLLVAKFVLDKTPRELKKTDPRVVKAIAPELRIFQFEDGTAPVTAGGEAGEARGPSTVREAMEARSRVSSWEEFEKRLPFDLRSVSGEKDEFELVSKRNFGRYRVGGRLIRKRFGSKVVGVYAWSIDGHIDKLDKIVDRIARSIEVNERDGASGMVSERIDRIYRRSKLGGIEWRKKIRAGLAKGWKAVDTDNYLIVHHTKNKGLIKRIARDIEAMRSFYMELFPPSGNVDRVSVLRLCQTKEEYHQYGGPPNTGGYWHPGNEELVLFDYSYTQRTLTAEQKKAMRGRKLSSKDSMLVLRHEAFHQYIFYAIGEFSPHDWFNEGYGDYFSGAVVHTNTGRVRHIKPSPWRIERAKRMASEGKGWLPLDKILKAERAQFYNRSRIGDYYAGAWAFVYFLKHSKEVEQHERWSKILDTYFAAVQKAYRAELKPFGAEPTLQNKQVAGFQARKKALRETLDGIDLDELEKVWRAWVVDMPEK